MDYPLTANTLLERDFWWQSSWLALAFTFLLWLHRDYDCDLDRFLC